MKKLLIGAVFGLYHFFTVGMCPIEDSSAFTLLNTPTTIILKANSGIPGTFSIVTPPANGTLGPIVPVSGPPVITATVEYTPDMDFSGVDLFAYTFDMTCTATVKIAVLSGDPNVDLTFAIIAKYMKYCNLLN